MENFAEWWWQLVCGWLFYFCLYVCCSGLRHLKTIINNNWNVFRVTVRGFQILKHDLRPNVNWIWMLDIWHRKKFKKFIFLILFKCPMKDRICYSTCIVKHICKSVHFDKFWNVWNLWKRKHLENRIFLQ